jgi:hypothetical protein
VLRGVVGVPEPAGGGGLRAHPSLLDVSVEVVAADAPFLPDLVSLQVAAADPVANGLSLTFRRAATSSTVRNSGSAGSSLGVIGVWA